MEEKKLKAEISKLSRLLEEAWGIICNAGGGNWDKETEKWRVAAMRFRDKYFEPIEK